MENLEYEGNLHSTQRNEQVNRDTSKLAYFHQIANGNQGRACDRLLQVMKAYGKPVTRQMASKLSGYPINCITQYVKILILENKVIESTVKAKCKLMKRMAYYLKLVEPITDQSEITSQ